MATFARASALVQLVEKLLTWQVVEVKGPRLSFCAVVTGGLFRTGDVLKYLRIGNRETAN